jgi:hypothetical protein
MSRRAFLKAAAVCSAGLPGCLFNARTELPTGPVLWKTFRFAHLTGLRLSFLDRGISLRWALRAAESLRGIPELDFLLLGGNLVEGTDPFDPALLETFLQKAGLPWYAVPTEGEGTRKTASILKRDAMNGRAWEPPWEDSPLRGVRLVGLATGKGDREDASRIEEQLEFLTGVLDRHPQDAVIVLVDQPVRLSPRATKLGATPVASEMLRFILEAAPNVKIVFSVGPAAFVRREAGLVYVGTPPILRYPHQFREITVSGHGVAIRNHPVGPPAEREAERKALTRTPLATRFNRAFPGDLVRVLEGESGERVYPLR